MASSMSASMAQSAFMSFLEGPVPEFVALDDKYLCVQCKQLLRQPQQTQCGHRICADCVAQLLANTDSCTCPGGDDYCDVITKQSVYPDIATSREMSRLKVYCPYKSYGCSVIALWSKLKEHKESCEYAVEVCPYAESGCREMVRKSELEKHAATCSYQPEPCPHCSMAIAKCNMENHILRDCEQALIPCPYKCGEQSIVRAQLPQHRLVCKAKPQECPYKDVGCTFLGSKEEIQAHQSEVDLHLQLVNKINEELRKKLQQALDDKGKLEKKVDWLENKVNRLERNIGSSTQDILDVQEKVRTHEQTLSTQDKKMSDTLARISAQDRKIAQVEQQRGGGGAAGNTSTPETNLKVLQIEGKVVQLDTRLQDIHQRFQHWESTSYDGTLVWKISEYQRRKAEAVAGTNVSLYSQPFYSSRFGYKMCLRVYLNGDGIGRNTHMSLFFVLMKGEFDPLLKWPFSPKVTLTLMDQERGIKPLSDTFRPDPTSSSFARPRLAMNIASGCPLFVAHSQLEASSFLKDDALFIKCVLGETDTTGV